MTQLIRMMRDGKTAVIQENFRLVGDIFIAILERIADGVVKSAAEKKSFDGCSYESSAFYFSVCSYPCHYANANDQIFPGYLETNF